MAAPTLRASELLPLATPPVTNRSGSRLVARFLLRCRASSSQKQFLLASKSGEMVSFLTSPFSSFLDTALAGVDGDLEACFITGIDRIGSTGERVQSTAQL